MNKYFKLSIFSLSILFLGSCKKFVDVNQNPNSAIVTTANYIFTGAQGNTFRNQNSTNVMIVPGTWTGIYAHSTSFTGGGAEKTYEYTNADFNAWSGLYDNLLDYKYVIDNADKDGVPQWKDPANVMQCYVWQQIVDLYGDAPYGEALQGVSNLTPKFTNQKTIYEDLVVRLDSAMARMNRATWSTEALVSRQDVMFQGNKTNWIRFANTLKLRILMRQSFMTGRDTYITTNINNTIANGYITTTGQNVFISPGYQKQTGKMNPFYENFGFTVTDAVVTNHSYRKMNSVLINFLKNTNDLFRLQSLAYPNGSVVTAPSSNPASYTGIPLGAGSGYATASSSGIGPFAIQPYDATRPGIFMTLAEAYFLQAEAAERYGITFGSTALALYQNGVISHFRLCAAPASITGSTTADATAATYLAQTTGSQVQNVNYALSTNKIKTILVQKWVAFTHINGLEAWSDYRKSGGLSVPTSVRTTATTTNPEPTRYLYPQVERNTNGANIPSAGDTRFTKLFWQP